jgi:pimeloyl-ACP methyl ester carboxylesterase
MSIRKDFFLDFGPGRRIHCVEAGQGTDVVYFPANGGSVEDMQLLIDRIAAKHRFVGIDGPGREPTEWPDESFSFFEDMPGVMDRALAELKVGPHVAMGHSMGGMYALHHARRHAGQVLALVLFEGFVTLPIHYATAAPDGFRPFRMRTDVADAFKRRFAANRAWEDERPAFKATFWPSQQPHDARPWVAELGLPILVFVAENGQKLPSSLEGWRRQLGMDRVDDLSVEVVPKAGHWMMLDDPERVGVVLMGFLERVTKDARER